MMKASRADKLDAGLQRQLALVMEIFNGFGEASPTGKRATREKGPATTSSGYRGANPGPRFGDITASGRTHDACVTKATEGDLMKKVYIFFINKEGCHDGDRGHR